MSLEFNKNSALPLIKKLMYQYLHDSLMQNFALKIKIFKNEVVQVINRCSKTIIFFLHV